MEYMMTQNLGRGQFFESGFQEEMESTYLPNLRCTSN
jgi:hypothetical protein